MNALAVSNLTVSIGGVVVVDGVSLEVAPGECLAIVGESGSGKTMTANALLGLQPGAATVTADELLVSGVDTRGFSERAWRDIRGRGVGLVSQDALVALDPLRRVGREVAESIEVHERASREEIGERVLSLLRDVAVPQPEVRSRQYPHELSGGLRQRALIASALAAGPRLLIADEPTTALDATVQRQILDLLAQLRDSGIGILLISHDLRAVARLADRVAVMQEGRLVEVGPTQRVMETPEHPYTRALLAAVPTVRVRTPESGEVILEARGLSLAYRRPDGGVTQALDDVSVEIRAGRTLGIVGESGSGKSTLARVLMGAERADAGEVLLDGRPWSALPERERRPLRGSIQLIDQDSYASFDPRYTVARIIGEAVALAGDDRGARDARTRELLEQVGLSPALLGRRARQLSGGQRQRVAIARAIARRPRILVCDEPVSALDASIQAQVLALLERLQRDLGLTLVFISHDLAVIRQMSDEIAVMWEGRVVESGEASEVLAAPQHPFTRALLAP